MNINPATILTKAIGAAAAGIILYDSHKGGVMISQQNIKEGIGRRLPDAYIQSRRQNDVSTVTSKLKDKIFKEQASFALPDNINAITGYLKGSFDQLASNLIPAVLATGALVKNRFSKVFGAGLAAYGLYYLMSNIFDVGKVKHFRD